MAGYTKIFNTIWGGSLYGHWEASAVFLVMLSLSDKEGVVDMTPEAIAGTTGWPLELILKGLGELEQPDTRSRTEVMGGRRLLRLDGHREWGWRITNYALYRQKMRTVERREYLTAKQAEYRLNTRVNKSTTVNRCGPIAEAKAEAESNKNKIAPDGAKEGDKEKEKDELWKAMIEACGISDCRPWTRPERRAWNGALKCLRDAAATPESIAGRARAFRRRWPGITLTPTALARRWSECVSDTGAPA
ncbi:MAG: hypothetical protein ACYDCJ_13020 [Gammaproteobacteria bacterium]